MATIRVKQSTSVSPERFVAALTDFGPGRGKIFAYSHEDSVTVHGRGDTWAEVTEGSAAGAWERLRYDWSQPNVVRLITLDSNIWSKGSGWVYTLTPRAEGGTDVDLVVVHEGRNTRGRLAAAGMVLAGKWILGRDLRRTLSAIEQSR
jgi:hypothetical protein